MVNGRCQPVLPCIVKKYIKNIGIAVPTLSERWRRVEE